MLPSYVTKYLQKECAMDIQVIVFVLLEYSIVYVSLQHEVQLNVHKNLVSNSQLALETLFQNEL
jgi:hypothetical protein